MLCLKELQSVTEVKETGISNTLQAPDDDFTRIQPVYL